MWSTEALISCRQRTSGCSRSTNAATSSFRARMPLTFQVTIFMRRGDLPPMRPAAEADAESRVSARAFVAVISAGIFVTGFGWPGIIGRIPFTLLLKNQLGLGADKVAGFWAVATFAWYCKPLVGLI